MRAKANWVAGLVSYVGSGSCPLMLISAVLVANEPQCFSDTVTPDSMRSAKCQKEFCIENSHTGQILYNCLLLRMSYWYNPTGTEFKRSSKESPLRRSNFLFGEFASNFARPWHDARNSDISLHSLFVLQMQNLDSIILFPVDRLLKTDFRGSKGDMKRPFDRSWKEYQDKYNELERQKKKLAKENGEKYSPMN